MLKNGRLLLLVVAEFFYFKTVSYTYKQTKQKRENYLLSERSVCQIGANWTLNINGGLDQTKKFKITLVLDLSKAKQIALDHFHLAYARGHVLDQINVEKRLLSSRGLSNASINFWSQAKSGKSLPRNLEDQNSETCVFAIGKIYLYFLHLLS